MKYRVIKTINYKSVTSILKKNSDIESNIAAKSKNTKAYFEILNFNLNSNFVDENMGYIVIKPKTYNSTKKYPAILLLHGLKGNANEWLEKGHLLEHYKKLLTLKSIDEMIIILPESGFHGESWYSNFNKIKNRNYESYFINELIPTVKKQFNIGKLGISGFSMGGYGSFKLGLKNIEIFNVIGSFAGAINLTRLSLNIRVLKVFKFIYLPKYLVKNRDKKNFLTVFSSWGDKILKEDPYSLIKYIDPRALKNRYFYLSIGSEDKKSYFMFQQWVDMVELLEKIKVSYRGYIYQGEEHTWDYINKNLDNFLQYSWKYLE